MPSSTAESLTPAQFCSRFTWLIILNWSLPPVVGFGFLLWIHMFTPRQVADILMSPTELLFVLGSLGFAVWFFRRRAGRIRAHLESPVEGSEEQVTRLVRGFPLSFWGIFLTYLAVAPSSVILSATWFSDFVATPIDWFRIHLVALTVSIVVGLPIFYLIFDLFGQVLGRFALEKPILTIRTKVFLIGSLIPLLIDTLLVQYYWSRTGFFTLETFGVWVGLELGAIYGTLIFVHSFGQSLRPLEEYVLPAPAGDPHDPSDLVPLSTDELGVLAARFRQLLEREGELEAQLLHAQKLEAVGRLAGGVAHDFNNDLTAILGNAELIREDMPPDHPVAQYVSAIIDSTERSANLVQKLLTFSRKRQITVARVDLNRIVRDIHGLLKRLMGNGVSIALDLHSGDLPAAIDRGQFEQALMNLCLNARDAMPDGGTLTIATARSTAIDDGPDTLMVSVADTGIGIDDSLMQSIFEPFFTTKDEGLGTGLGLAMVYGVVTAHGGSIDVASDPGQGATFKIGLPAFEG